MRPGSRQQGLCPGARDLPRLREFCCQLGRPTIIDDGEFAAFDVRGVVLALFPLTELARDGNTEPDIGSGGIRFTVIKEPVDAEFFAGRSAYLCDPEGNYFEITWTEPNNPITLRRMTRS